MSSSDEKSTFDSFSMEVMEANLKIEAFENSIRDMQDLKNFKEDIEMVLLYLWWNGIRGFIKDRRIKFEYGYRITIPINYETDIDADKAITECLFIAQKNSTIRWIDMSEPKLVKFPSYGIGDNSMALV